MAKVKSKSEPSSRNRQRPAISPEARESQLISRAYDLAEQQLIDGTASSQVITHFLKLATAKARLELEKLQSDNDLAKAKTKALESNEYSEKMYEDAIRAMRNYSGQGDPEEYEDY